MIVTVNPAHTGAGVSTSNLVSGFGFRVSDFGFQVSGFGFRVSGLQFRVKDSRVSGSEFRV